MAQTKQKGFYVSAGEVQLLKDKTPASKGPKAASSPSKLKPGSASGREKSPMSHVENSEDDTKAGGKRRAEEWLYEGRKKRKVDNEMFSPELEAHLTELKEKISAGAFAYVFLFSYSPSYYTFHRELGQQGQIPSIHQTVPYESRLSSHPQRRV